MATSGMPSVNDQTVREQIAFSTAQQSTKRMFVGKSQFVQRGGVWGPVALWYTCYWEGTNGAKTQLYDGPDENAKLLRPQTKFQPDFRTFPTTLLRLGEEKWKDCARELHTAHFGPPTHVRISGNGTFIPDTFETWGERMPDVEGVGKPGLVWISDAECEARFHDLSVECPEPVLKRMRLLYIARDHRRSTPHYDQGKDYWHGLRQEHMERHVNHTINAAETVLKKLETEPDDYQDADALRKALAQLQTDKAWGKLDTSTWKHVRQIRKIIGYSDVKAMPYEEGMLWYDQRWTRRYGKDR